MEAAQLPPHGGERPDDPGALETGDPGSIGGNEATRLENTAAGDARTWNDETPGAGHVEGSKDPRARNDGTTGGPRACRDEATGGPRACRDETTGGPRAYKDETTRGPRACRNETTGEPRARNDETPGGPRARNDETTGGPRACRDETTGGPRARNDETTGGPRACRDETTGGPRTCRDETAGGARACRDETTGGPRACRDETTRGARARINETTGEPSCSAGPGDPVAISDRNENPRSEAGADPNDARAASPDKRLTGSHGHEGTHDARTWHEGPDAVRSAQSYDAAAKDPTEQSHAGSGGSTIKGAESFKKPIAPLRSGGNEKTLDQHDKPGSATTSAQLPSLTSREKAPDVSARLPSDAYRTSPTIPYEEPAWSGRPQALYTLETLKDGSILSTKSLNGSSWTVFGRLPTCHVSLEHPSVSRYHAVLQYRSVPGTEQDQDPGFYVYDLGSTHGTFINKQRIQSKTYSRFRVGHVLKFGGGTRLFVLQGPDEDQEAESDMTVTQIKEARRHRENLQKMMLGDDSDEEEPEEEDREKEKERGGSEEAGCMWGMGDDAEEEESDVNPIAMEYQVEREALYSKDPKKTLQGFFDREGEELDFEYEERGIGSWFCRVKLPADDSSGKQLVAEVVHSGKKKDAMRLCCMEACRILDMRGLLRQEAVSRKRKGKQWEDEDFYDSDDDTFLDRTGIVEKKRLNRMKKAGKIEEKPETYESLTAKLVLVEKEITEVAEKLRTNRQGEAQTSTQDSLDAFMTEIKSGASLDNVTRKKLHLQSLELKKEQQRLKSLIKIVQPTKLPELKTDSAAQDSKTKKLTLPMFGAMKGGSKFKLKTGTVGVRGRTFVFIVGACNLCGGTYADP
ncbi:kanadaptin-like [Hyla sarda]|uniref:kanadaptin-like n=1 Tax=Hyla sarda TaxID=327740 RepID=UPI0024C2CF63|nr:kanadaptin-like [Hyla sarda]